MIATSEDIATILQAETSLVLGTDLFINKEPALPNACVTIFDTSGGGSDLTLDRAGYQRTSFQLRIRDSVQLTASTLCQTLLGVLDGLGNEAVGDTIYMVIYLASGPALLDWDGNDRIRFIINFNTLRKE